MPWAKIDDRLHSHPKFTAVSLSAVGLWVYCLSWAAGANTDGKLPAAIVKRYGGDDWQVLATELVDAELWDKSTAGYIIHDYLEYNFDSETVKERKDRISEARSKAGKRAAEKRWSNKSVTNGYQTDNKDDNKTVANGYQTVYQNDAPLPVPVPTITTPLVDTNNKRPETLIKPRGLYRSLDSMLDKPKPESETDRRVREARNLSRKINSAEDQEHKRRVDAYFDKTKPLALEGDDDIG